MTTAVPDAICTQFIKQLCGPVCLLPTVLRTNCPALVQHHICKGHHCTSSLPVQVCTGLGEALADTNKLSCPPGSSGCSGLSRPSTGRTALPHPLPLSAIQWLRGGAVSEEFGWKGANTIRSRAESGSSQEGDGDGHKQNGAESSTLPGPQTTTLLYRSRARTEW
ncbi:hypothetical protein CROQUDRAFT_87008 [Cronartium quercuum f. sp. fusiforme G11]|uniref:Uncharacterized protein n=1 Tax=Cronartium quercuum f. sp. fusiforme G11 TaxID=708437 RepID=A0A9P6NS40_9BASI|nr:hypothetical protein CROQUDRAFT_87008 [Cronartium quercuum f. sp. fusiforme G11]